MKPLIKYLTIMIAAAAGGIIIGNKLPSLASGEKDSAEKEPLYWVAPMDPEYRRDKPGKSPMGMDLIPVYEEGQQQKQHKAGSVMISPAVVNNLGVRTKPVALDTLSFDIQTVGYVQFDEGRLRHIHPRVKGWIDRLYIKTTGEEVSKGEPLYSLYSPELVNAQEEYLLALRRDNKNMINAARERLQALQLPDAFIKQLGEKRQVRQTVTFYAAQNGIIDDLNIREGFYVQPGTKIMSVGGLDVVWVEAEVFERQAALVHAGQAVTMYLDYLPGRTWQGKVDYVYPTLDPDTRTARIRLRFDNSDHELKPNMFAEVVIHARSEEKALLVPRQAVIRTGHKNRVVKALDDGYFRSINVKTGKMNDDFITITEGLNKGDRVVVSAQFLIDSESSKKAAFERMDHDKGTQHD